MLIFLLLDINSWAVFILGTSRPNNFTHSKRDQKYGCNVCGRNYKYKQTLVHHQRFECGKEPMFQCPMCPHRAKQKSNLKTHMGLKHTAAMNIQGIV